MSQWLKVLNSPEIINNPNCTYNKMKTVLQDGVTHLGGFTVNLVPAMLLHSNLGHLFHDIANALDSHWAINEDLKITSCNVL